MEIIRQLDSHANTVSNFSRGCLLVKNCDKAYSVNCVDLLFFQDVEKKIGASCPS